MEGKGCGAFKLGPSVEGVGTTRGRSEGRMGIIRVISFLPCLATQFAASGHVEFGTSGIALVVG